MLTDSHAHLFLPEFKNDLPQVLDRAACSGVNRILNAAIDIPSSKEVTQMAAAWPSLYAAVGIHPQSAGRPAPGYMEQLRQIALASKVVAVGEIGLDYYRHGKHREAQMSLFDNQLELASQVGLPVILHCREAEDDMQAIVKAWAHRWPPCRDQWRGVRHCFNADMKTAGFYIENGFMLSFGGYIGYPSSTGLRRTIGQIPLVAILLETDCPYLPPQQFRGKRNEPGYLAHTARVMAEIKGVDYPGIAEITTANAAALFNFQTL